MPEMPGVDVPVLLSGPAVFRWSRRSVDDAVVVFLAGELDLSTAELGPLLLAVAEWGAAGTIVLDMSDVSFIDAYCIGLIVRAGRAAEAGGRVLQVEGLRGLPARVFGLLGLERMMVGGTCGETFEGSAGGR